MKDKREFAKKQKLDFFVIFTKHKSENEMEKIKNRIIEEEKEKLNKNVKKIEQEYLRREEELKEIEKIFSEEIILTDEEKENLRNRIKGLRKEKSFAEEKRELIEQSNNEIRKRIKKERRRVIEKNAKSAKLKVKLASLSAAIALGGLGAGAFGHYALGEAKENKKTEITIDASKYPDGVNVENVKNDRQVLLDGLDAKEYVQKTELELIKDKTAKQVDSLKSGDDILNYLKEFYVDEYNERMEENITTDNVVLYVEFSKSPGAMYKLYRDVAENGDEIIRRTSQKDTVKGIESDLISATVRDNEGNQVLSEYISYSWGNCTKVYDSDEYVECYDDKDSCLMDVGKILRHGLCYYAEVTNDKDKDSDRSIELRKEYREDLVDAVAEYEQMDKHFIHQNDEER